jgi:NADPH:quinone reductase-like Zn-dependent oxidoreductase
MSNRAIVIKSLGEAEVIDIKSPKLREDYILVKVAAIALNPTDVSNYLCAETPSAK